MRTIKTFCTFICVFLVYHIFFGCNVFPMNEAHVLQAPAWYPIVGILLSAGAAYWVYRTCRPHKAARSFRGESDTDIAARIVLETEQASVSMIQRKTGWNYKRAARAMDELERIGIVGPFNGSTPRQILLGKSHTSQQTDVYQPAPAVHELSEVDGMDGHAFEYWCADLLKKIGFSEVEVTQGSGDQGVDILAEKDGIKYAIQCKCYASDLGNKPVQEVNTGKAIYHCQIGAVITNRHFTHGGKEAAEATGVLLWDRDWIQSKLNEITL